MNEKACNGTVAEPCTKCHATARICNSLKGGGMDAENWRTTVARSGRKADLLQDFQDSVPACLTISAGPGKRVCEE